MIFYSLEEYLVHFCYYYLVTSEDVEKSVKLTHYKLEWKYQIDIWKQLPRVLFICGKICSRVLWSGSGGALDWVLISHR